MKLTIENDKKRRFERVYVEGAANSDIIFRNFRGEKRKYNDAGKRNFNIALNIPVEFLDQLCALGLNIKELPPREGDEYGDEPLRFVKVNVAYGGKFPPNLYLVNQKKKLKELNENELALLDTARFVNADLVLRTYHRDEQTTTLYIDKGYFTIEQDPISEKYAYMTEVDDDGELPWDEDQQ